MTNLAIRGHKNRGKEVIEILEMLGGVNKYEISYAKGDLSYAIRSHDKSIIGVYPTNTFIVFTIEEFFEKFPYKVGDKVLAFNEQCSIANAFWDKERNEVLYLIHIIQGGYVRDVSRCEIQPYKEESDERIKELL